jgi:hypothetical protein
MVVLIREKALSELIGFILLLALLILLASLYLTYVVPANGREAEIAHMDYIKGQFLDYKISTDALRVNRANNVPVSQAITLGTQGVKTAGMFAGFQLFSPVFSSGEISVRHTNPPEKLSVTVKNPLYSSSYIASLGNPADYNPNYLMNEMIIPDSGSGIIALNQTPSHLYVNFSTSSVTHVDLPVKKRYPAEFPSEYGMDITGPECTITLTAVPRYLTKDYNWTYLFHAPDNTTYNEYWIRYQTDLLLHIIKGGVNILDRYPVYTNILNTTERSGNYTIDLMDPAYGLSPGGIDFSKNLSVQKYNPASVDFTVASSATTGYDNASLPASLPVPVSPISESGSTSTERFMGRLEYRSHNVYYQNQENFVYQLGGVYVNQTEGSSPLNIPPLSITRSADTNSLNVDITDISLSGETAISGSSPVQVQTTLDNIRYSGLDSSQPNAGSVIIKVENTDRPDLWKLIFNSIKKNAGSDAVPMINVTSDQDSSTMIIIGPDTSDTWRDVKLTVTYVDYTVDLDAVGKTIGI